MRSGLVDSRLKHVGQSTHDVDKDKEWIPIHTRSAIITSRIGHSFSAKIRLLGPLAHVSTAISQHSYYPQARTGGVLKPSLGNLGGVLPPVLSPPNPPPAILHPSIPPPERKKLSTGPSTQPNRASSGDWESGEVKIHPTQCTY